MATARRILIVGGVAGGASAAARARRMNELADITLYEKDGDVSFANCGLPYYIGGEITERNKLLVASAELLTKRFRINVKTQHEVISVDPTKKQVVVRERISGKELSESYDKLILAPGASPMVPPMDGATASNVLTLRNLEDADRIKQIVDNSKNRTAVIVGGGFIGLEIVEQLVGLGFDVSLVELMPQVLPLLDPEMAYPIMEALEAKGVKVHLRKSVTKFIEKDGVAVSAEIAGGQQLAADFFILGIGVTPNVSLARDAGLKIGQGRGIAVNDFMQTSDPDIYAVGDAVEYLYGPTGSRARIALAGPANRAGRVAGEHAATGNSSQAPPVLGTSIVRVFGLTAGMTGLTRKLATKFGIEAKSTIVLSNHHAGYYPGAKMMTLKLVYAPGTGKILGAQAIGEEGIDKRIDVIATAMAFGGTVRQLEGVDLTYAPPFGSAKDPVHMAAFAACNELDGLVRFIDPDADLSGYQVVDVRSAKEVERAALTDVPHVIHIPLDELRERLGELDRTRPTVTSCASGLRSYVAARILSQNGFAEVFDLSGAATIRRRAIAATKVA